MRDSAHSARVRLQKRRAASLSAFDVIMLAVIGLLGTVISIVILRGDQVGLAVQSYSPATVSSSRSSIQITLDDPLTAPISDSALTISPSVAGKVTVSGSQISFEPSQPLVAKTPYTVTLHAGLQATTGRALKQDVQWTFRVAPPRVLYLGPTDNIVQNLYLIDPSQPGQPTQLTFSQTGLQSYDVAPNGSYAVYSEVQADGTDSLSTLDLTSFTSNTLYPCTDSFCTNPAISPDGKTIAFEKANLNS